MPTALGNTVSGDDKASRISYPNYALLLLTLTYTANIIDRNILIILIEPIKAEMHLSDTQIGFLTGISFALFYAVVGIPLAILADRGNRRNIIGVTLALFSAMTFLCGLVTNFIQLLFARIFLAIGEAGTTPSSQSMISDLFTPGKRATAIGIYSMATNFGALIGFLVGGWVSHVYGWRMAFFVVGLPGFVLVALIFMTLKEPERGQSDTAGTAAADARASFADVLRMIWRQPSLRHILAGVSVNAIGSYALIIWYPSFLSRSFAMSSGEVGTVMAIIMGSIGAIGTYLSGFLADRLGRRDVRWYLWLVAVAGIATFPALVAMYLSAYKWLTLTMFIVPSLAFAVYLAPSIAMMHALVSVRMRAQSSALFFLVMTLVGQSIGPQLAGFLSDLYSPRFGSEALRYALLSLSIFPLWCATHFLLAARTLKADLARVDSWRGA